MALTTESASTYAVGKPIDNDFDLSLTYNDGFTDPFTNADRMMVDPRLAMPLPINVSDKPSEPTFAISPSIWDQQLDSSTPLFCQFKNGEEPIDIGNDVNSEAMASFKPRDSIATRKSSHTSSNSSFPSLTSSTSSHNSQAKKQTRNPARKKQQSLRKQEPKSKNKYEDPKRNKYLERNRLAASKCRHKKKEWVQNLEETRGILETKHHSLQREYSALTEEVSQLKNFLMAHSGCNDANIDQWIQAEARQFARKSLDGSFAALGHRPSGSPSSPTPESPQSSTVSANHCSLMSSSPEAGHFPHASSKRQELNFDHMPDDMFQ
ncbi:unnamed protein product [Clonostachys rosea f. rosea IK726]|uniref:Uncharacterized protein n=1 Tax=Clonostachys rosea f. rosea IK726 TaxID=1349383 RepID=A0ACA9UQP0_BIOOC|nr:unnamed protein product [Clonostachys rosea f. rosea IK726]